MRTTLSIADDVLFAAKDFARRDKKTLAQVIPEWDAAPCKILLSRKKRDKQKSKVKACPQR